MPVVLQGALEDAADRRVVFAHHDESHALTLDTPVPVLHLPWSAAEGGEQATVDGPTCGLTRIEPYGHRYRRLSHPEDMLRQLARTAASRSRELRSPA
ncbi:hypothetical protein SHO565_76700 [Streptomyces sp. HO565]